MAGTEFGLNSYNTRKAWSQKTFTETIGKTFISQFLGTSDEAGLVMLPDLEKSAGDRIRVPLIANLTGDGVVGAGVLDGAEEALIDYHDDLVINLLRNGVEIPGRITEQRTLINLREQARKGLQKWYKVRQEVSWLNQLAGNTAETRIEYTGLNPVTAPDADHLYLPESVGTEASVSTKAASANMKLEYIDDLIGMAKTADPIIQPMMVNGQEMYGFIMHTDQETEFFKATSNSEFFSLQKAVIQGGEIRRNPIFTGALGVYKNVILYSSNYIPLAPSLTTVRRAVFFGAQSSAIAFGKADGGMKMFWDEKKSDYNDKYGVAVGMLYGVKKLVFNSKSIGVIVCPTTV
ncbi:MAG: N4-gp56 family major capsid protein [Candidatus Peribacteraceae bacterium]|nr:N4-gp56 family major capsid protein [Candidatus Peribacteraceae bacterium]